MIEMKRIRELVKLMVANGLTELDLEGEGERVTLKRGGESPGHSTHGPATHASIAPTAPAPHAPTSGTTPPTTTSKDDGLLTIRSPMVGTFYAKPNPDAKPFIAVGDRINEDSVVCIIEAMKVFNEIKAETSGTVEKILAENGQAVEFDQPLYLVRPG